MCTIDQEKELEALCQVVDNGGNLYKGANKTWTAANGSSGVGVQATGFGIVDLKCYIERVRRFM